MAVSNNGMVLFAELRGCMLEIVLLILKIAGIILAVVLGILITGIFCVLFVPVRYRGDFSVSDAEEGRKKNIGAVLRATWLLWLVRVYVSYEEAVRVRVKVFFFTVMDTAREKKVRNKRKRKEKKTGKAGKIENEKDDTENTVYAGNTIRKENTETTEGKEVFDRTDGESEGSSLTKEADEKDKDNGQDDKIDREAKKSDKGKKKKTIKERISNILQTIRNFCDKLKGIKEKAEEIKVLWHSDHMASSRSLLWREFLYLLRHTKPRKLEGYLRFGFDDPSTTGYAMAVYGILCSVWRPKLSVEPDFERQVLESHIKMKGKIRACHFVKTALKLFFSKDLRRVIKDIQK